MTRLGFMSAKAWLEQAGAQECLLHWFA